MTKETLNEIMYLIEKLQNQRELLVIEMHQSALEKNAEKSQMLAFKLDVADRFIAVVKGHIADQ